MQGLLKVAEEQPSWSAAFFDAPVPQDHKERMIQVKHSLGGGLAGAGLGASIGGAAGGGDGAALGTILGGSAGLLGGAVMGNKRTLDDRHARGADLYSEEENRAKSQAHTNMMYGAGGGGGGGY